MAAQFMSQIEMTSFEFRVLLHRQQDVFMHALHSTYVREGYTIVAVGNEAKQLFNIGANLLNMPVVTHEQWIQWNPKDAATYYLLYRTPVGNKLLVHGVKLSGGNLKLMLTKDDGSPQILHQSISTSEFVQRSERGRFGFHNPEALKHRVKSIMGIEEHAEEGEADGLLKDDSLGLQEVP